MWEKFAKFVSETYGAFVDWDERFFICPECEEPIYECDWEEEDFSSCPVCGIIWENDE